MDWLNQLVTVVNDFLWTNIVIVMLVGIGLWFTLRTGFVQIRRLPEMLALLTEGAGAAPRKGHISTFQPSAFRPLRAWAWATSPGSPSRS